MNYSMRLAFDEHFHRNPFLQDIGLIYIAHGNSFGEDLNIIKPIHPSLKSARTPTTESPRQGRQ